jgi:hypothetical protein
MNSNSTATFKRDRDGVWGILCPTDQATPGATIIATKRSGETSTVTIATVADDPGPDGRIFCWLGTPETKTTEEPQIPDGPGPHWFPDMFGGPGVIVTTSLAVPGQQVTVTKPDGTTVTVTIAEVCDDLGDGRHWCKVPDGRPALAGDDSPVRCVTGGNCSSFGNGRCCGGADCDGH